MNYCRAAEAANSQLKQIASHGTEAVHQLNDYKKGGTVRERIIVAGNMSEEWRNALHIARLVQSV